MREVGITYYATFSAKECDEEVLQNINYRTTDAFTKCAISAVRKLMRNVDLVKIERDSLGILIATSTGTAYSVKNVYSMYKDKGYRGINPSFFPNIMMSTALAWCTKLTGAHGNSTTMHVSRGNAKEEILEYVNMQIESKRCQNVIVIYLNEGEGGYCFMAEKVENMQLDYAAVNKTLDMNLVKDKYMYCLECAVTTINRSLQKDHEMIFSKMWNFNFDYQKAQEIGKAGEAISSACSNEKILDLAEEYYGLHFEYKETYSASAFVKVVISELMEGRATFSIIDKQHIPWMKNQNQMDYGLPLIIGIEDGNLICLDVHTAHGKKLKLKVQDMLAKDESYIRYYIYRSVGKGKECISCDEFREHVKDNMEEKKAMLQNIRQLADFVREQLDLQKEWSDQNIQNVDDLYNVPFIFKLADAVRSRKLIYTMLKYIYKRTSDSEAFFLSIHFNEISQKWESIYSTLYRYMIMGRSLKDEQREKLADTILSIHELEQELIEVVCTGKYKKSNVGILEEDKLEECQGADYYFVDLQEIMNNRAISYTEDNSEGADLTGRNESFYFTEEPALIQNKYMQFQLSPKTSEWDNIVCDGQTIEVPKQKFKRVMFLGCTEWGEGGGWLKVIYKNGEEEIAYLVISDWYADSVTNGTKMFTAKIHSQIVGKRERSAYGFSFKLKDDVEIEKIQLPRCKNMHIMAISLF